MNVLGISCYYHDSSATMIKEGKIVAAAHEERFSRKKHDLGFPKNAIQYCLNETGISINEVDAIGFYEKPFLKFERLLMQFVETYPFSLNAFVETIPTWLSEKLLVEQEIRSLGFKKDIYYLEHHLAHAASTFLVSPFKEAAILTVDGVGEWDTTTFGAGKDDKIEIIKSIEFPHSLGLLYSAVTAFLGFTVNNSEYKVMGLAPYGKPKYLDEFRKIIDLKDDGSFALDMDYFCYHYKMAMFSEKFVEVFGELRKKETKVDQKHMDIAASLQAVTEECLLNMLNALYNETGQKNLAFAGGVALNSVANGKILSKTKFKNIFIQPSAGDAGTSMGAAAYVNVLKKQKRPILENAFLGPHFSDIEIEKFLKQNQINYSKFKSRDELLKETSKMLYNNKILGWFQGRMEWGPRALGARSILSNPCEPKMKDILNIKVKHREHFRPFAPVITEEDVYDYFEADKPLPEPSYYMLMVYPIKEDKRKKIPAVTHVDGSGRLQVIKREQNPLYYDLIKEFEKLSKVPILINTSFNIRGEPIACTPFDAYKCMMGTGIDGLVMESFFIEREKNPQDMWDSEKIATD